MINRIEQEKILEAMLLESVEKGDYTPLTKQDLKDIKMRGLERLRERPNAQMESYLIEFDKFRLYIINMCITVILCEYLTVCG